MKKEISKQNQNYFLLPIVLLQMWFERQAIPQGDLAPQLKALPSSQPEEKVNIDFSDWDGSRHRADLVIEEYLWGIRCGVMQFVNPDVCSFNAVLTAARTDQMCEIYSPAKVQYFADGSRKVIPHDVSAYNTDAEFGCWGLIGIKQAKNLFPQYWKIFDRLPKETKFLCSPEADKLRIANQEKGEIGFSFDAVDVEQPVSFFLGNLRPTFQYIANEIAEGRGARFCRPEEKQKLDFLKSKICLMSGGCYPYNLAMTLASEKGAAQIRKDYVKNGLKGKDSFWLLINGECVDKLEGINQMVKEDGSDINICVPPSVYKSWGKPFTVAELQIINASRRFIFDSQSENDYFNKINRLRFDNRLINIVKWEKGNKIIEVEEVEKLIERRFKKLDEQLKDVLEHEQRERYSLAQGLSGPTRRSMYTNYYSI